MDRSMLYFGGIMVAAFVLMAGVNSVFPPPLNQQIGGGIYLAAIIGGIIGLEATYIITTSKYPYIGMLIRPENEEINLFIDMPQSKRRKVGDNLWSDTLILKYPQKIKAYGNVAINQLRLTHEYQFEQRIQFRPGSACKDDYDFSHPQTEKIEVIQILNKETAIDRAEVIPEFKLLSARNDYRLKFNNPGSTNLATTTNPKGDQSLKIKEQEIELAQVRNEVEYWHQQAISLEQWVVQQRTETRGLLDAKGGVKEFAIEFVLTLLVAMGKIDKVAGYLRGSKWDRWGKEVFAAIVIVFFIFYLWQNPSILNGIYIWASDPMHQLTLALIAVVIGAIMFYLLSRRR